jgi:hypothetical protein
MTITLIAIFVKGGEVLHKTIKKSGSWHSAFRDSSNHPSDMFIFFDLIGSRSLMNSSF